MLWGKDMKAGTGKIRNKQANDGIPLSALPRVCGAFSLGHDICMPGAALAGYRGACYEIPINRANDGQISRLHRSGYKCTPRAVKPFYGFYLMAVAMFADKRGKGMRICSYIAGHKKAMLCRITIKLCRKSADRGRDPRQQFKKSEYSYTGSSHFKPQACRQSFTGRQQHRQAALGMKDKRARSHRGAAALSVQSHYRTNCFLLCPFIQHKRQRRISRKPLIYRALLHKYDKYHS